MKKAIRIGGLVLALFLIIGIMIFSVTYKPTVKTDVWNEAMTKGDENGKPYIMYTDLACPYCLKFAEAVNSHRKEFNENYIDNGKVRFEVRVTQYNYQASGNENSRTAGESTYCAADQDKFWPYYEALTHKMYEDYYSENAAGTGMPEFDTEFYASLAKSAGLDVAKFTTCLENGTMASKIESATSKYLASGAEGVPYFLFNGNKVAGFGGTWDMDNNYQLADKMMKAYL